MYDELVGLLKKHVFYSIGKNNILAKSYISKLAYIRHDYKYVEVVQHVLLSGTCVCQI